LFIWRIFPQITAVRPGLHRAAKEELLGISVCRLDALLDKINSGKVLKELYIIKQTIEAHYTAQLAHYGQL